MITTSIIFGILLVLIFDANAFGIGVVIGAIVYFAYNVIDDILSKGSNEREEKESFCDEWTEFDCWQDNQGL
ncbi:MAG: hypothetical protein KBS41_00210 [Oscillospiraceae bacterium]|nr:hypothetical protein [Candidatus Equicaccousia limihippi]